MIRTFAIAFLALAALNGEAAAQDARPVLRAQATVTGDLVRIGDLIENAGIVSDVAIFRAPDIGTTGTVSTTKIIDAVRPHAIVGLNTAGLTEVTVTHAGHTIPARDIETLLVTALVSQYPLGEAGDLTLTFDGGKRDLQIDISPNNAAPRVASITYNARNGRFDAVIEVGGARRRVAGVATAMADVVTLTRPLSRGDVFKLSDTIIERRPRSEVSADMLTTPDQANGQAARSALVPGRPLRNTDIMKAEIVRRNDNVTIVYEMPGITLTLRGKASEGGAEGDTIEVLNVQSKRVMQGVVAGPGRVLVTMAAPNVVAEADPKTLVSSKAQNRAQ